MKQLELVKVICVSVIAVRENGKIVGEVEGKPTPCYSPDELQAYFAQAEAEVAQQNALQNGNRQQRRKKEPVG